MSDSTATVIPGSYGEFLIPLTAAGVTERITRGSRGTVYGFSYSGPRESLPTILEFIRERRSNVRVTVTEAIRVSLTPKSHVCVNVTLASPSQKQDGRPWVNVTAKF